MNAIAKPLAEVTDRELVRSLGSTLCPSCGGRKGERKTFCYAEFKALPGKQQQATYNRLGSGYREAVAEGLKTLGRGDQFKLPTTPLV
jgi:hypothetical protein